MSNSTLVTRVNYADPSNYTKGRSQNLRGIVIHHACAYNIESVVKTFQTKGRNGSAHYCVCGNDVCLLVNECDTAWHCSNWNGNCRTIGIEVCNSTLSPDYKIADDTFNTLCKLVAEIAKRNNFGKLEYLPNGDGTGITGHKDWYGASTACPGPTLYPRLKEICDIANEINYPSIVFENIQNTKMITKSNAKLIDIKTGNIIKTYEKGVEIEFTSRVIKNNTIYLRSKYSTDNNILNVISIYDMEDIKVKEEKNTDTVKEEKEFPEETEQKIEEKDTKLEELEKLEENIQFSKISLIQKIINFIVEIFTRKGKK